MYEKLEYACFNSYKSKQEYADFGVVPPFEELCQFDSLLNLLQELSKLGRLGYIHLSFCLQISQYLSLYARTGVLPSTIFQGKAAEVCHLL